MSSIDESAKQDDEVSYPKFVSVRVLSGHRAAVNSVLFLDDVVATASGDRSVRLWNLHSGAVLQSQSDRLCSNFYRARSLVELLIMSSKLWTGRGVVKCKP